MKNKLLVFGITGMFLMINFVAFPSIGIKTIISEKNPDYNIVDNEIYMYGPTIVIEDDDDFTSENGVVNPDAKGTKDDHYIISGQEFQYISIANTRKYFIITDCIINVKGIGVSFINVNNGIIQDCVFQNMESGVDVLFADSYDNTIEHCSISYEEEGNYFFFVGYRSDNNEIHHCDIAGLTDGFIFTECDNNKIHHCNISGGTYGFALEQSNNNIIHHNNVFDNKINARVHSGGNQWDDGNGEGNYWDDYMGRDNNGDGIGEESYLISNDNKDRYPFMKPIDKSKSKPVNLREAVIDYFPVLERILQLFKIQYKAPVTDTTAVAKPRSGSIAIIDRNSGICSALSSLFLIMSPDSYVENEIGNSVTYITSPSHDGWIEERDGVTILHISGSYYDMGYQHGDLLKDKIQENFRAQLSYFEDTGWTYNKILEVWDDMKGNLPQEYKDEIQGMADGSGLPFNDIAVLNNIPAIFNHAASGSCCEVALWGSTTKNGDLYHIRGWDWRLDIQDPVTGTYLQETQILIVRDPDNSYASLYPEFAGHIFSWAGFNEKGIAIGETTCSTDDYTFDGISSAFRMRMVLDYASTGDEAINIMSSDRTCGWNFVISDGMKPEGTAIEQTANILYVGKWNDPVEATNPFWQIKDVVRRVPFFIYPEAAATSPNRGFYDPSGIIGFIFYLLGIDGSFGVWYFYKTISEAIEDRYGTLDLESTVSMIRDVYEGKTNLLFYVIMKIGFVHSVRQWVACPETGDLAISFANADTYAFKNPVHYFNLFDLLESGPP